MARPAGRAAQTAAAIERAAIGLVLERGYDHVTVDMIAEAAGVSQRTFFNHFPTKDDAILGTFKPEVDERAAREFIVGKGSLLVEAMTLMRLPESFTAEDMRLHALRMKAVAASPALFARQMEVFGGLHQELTGIMRLRLRTERPDAPAEEIDADADLAANMLAGVMKALGGAVARDGGVDLEASLLAARDSVVRVLGAGGAK